MNVYLNDLSCSSSSLSLFDNIDKIERFITLLETLQVYGFRQVITDSQPGRLKLCDRRIEAIRRDNTRFDVLNLILSLTNHLIYEPDLDSSNRFRYNHLDSALLAYAHETGRPVVSFAFTPEYEVDKIKGELRNKHVEIVNYHHVTQSTLTPYNLVSTIQCCQQDPLKNPLWNKEATQAYHKSIEHQLAMINTNPGEKIVILKNISEAIAELNGWTRDTNLSRINSTRDAIRNVFRSEKFKKVSYLSVDFEKADIYFELFDKRGRHKGEYKWDGTLSGEAEPQNHKLKLKK